jgi:hypothetical protein
MIVIQVIDVEVRSVQSRSKFVFSSTNVCAFRRSEMRKKYLRFSNRASNIEITPQKTKGIANAFLEALLASGLPLVHSLTL